MNNGSCGSKFGDSGQKVGEPDEWQVILAERWANR